MKHLLRRKKILITAGPTWVAIDDVRVVSNVSTGELGSLLTQAAVKAGMDVDVFLGTVSHPFSVPGAQVFRFRYFDELCRLIETQLRRRKYDAILHAAAVSDYLARAALGKISSRNTSLTIRLHRAPKLVARLRRLNPKAFLVMFKLEAGVGDKVLMKRALEAKKKCRADLVVANRFTGGGYRGFILGRAGAPSRGFKRRELAQELVRILKERLAE